MRFYVPRVAYSYAVDGRPYANDRLSLAKEEGYRELDEAEGELEPYATQTAVQVHYPPDQPSDSAMVIEKVRWTAMAASSLRAGDSVRIWSVKEQGRRPRR